MIRLLLATPLLAATVAHAQIASDPFRQLEEVLPSPNSIRTASGAPGPDYWQQRADYRIEVALDETTQSLSGSERITYTNHSPDILRYLWVQLDPNLYTPDSHGNLSRSVRGGAIEKMDYRSLKELLTADTFDGEMKVHAVRDAAGATLGHQVVHTMMRIDLDQALRPGDTVAFEIDWTTALVEAKLMDSRGGWEYFAEDDNYLFEVAQWFPRMAAYTDVNGWQHKQFIGEGEFTLEMGDYEVAITVPADHVVGSTGVLQNPKEVLGATQLDRLEEARDADEPLFIVSPEEAATNQASRSSATRTWVFHAEDVRDFAWASSRKFIWDAVGHKVGGRRVMAMSFYPNEGEPLWSRYSTHAVVHTLDVYSRFTFPYPYPVAISVNGPVGGMEYPMISFNGPRPEKDGTYRERTKYGLISVIIHEVGHNYFPMIVNSDERQWTWMDEGINSFLQYVAEKEWEEDYPSRRGEPRTIVEYMTSDAQVPVMTNSESLLQFGKNAYAKPAAALTILRETILGRDLFDFAFREYSRRWRFKRPMPADFFRSIEDASAMDLDWFWRGWFYGTDHADLAIADLVEYTLDTGNPEIDKARRRDQREDEPESLTEIRNRDIEKRVARHPDLEDFYNTYDELDVTAEDREEFRKLLERIDEDEETLLETDKRVYVAELENRGGLVMPVILEIRYADGSTEEVRIPAEIWRRNRNKAAKLLLADQEIVRIEIDPQRETADADIENNVFPPETKQRRFELQKEEKKPNPMQKAKEAS
ncbi:MAG: M1 family aminopeptidase [Acidobacteriota bacterium]|nr:M1 family aminopeptidase [Acidobacteriota bacterium]